MFRPMRRSKQELSPEESIAILKRGTTGVLAVHGDDGYPYGVPINYVYHEGKIYLHGAKSGHKMDALKRSDKVSFTVIDKDDIVPEELTSYFRSVILFGRARVLDDPAEIRATAEILGMHFYPKVERVQASINKEMPALAMIEIQIEHLTGKEAIELVRMREQH